MTCPEKTENQTLMNISTEKDIVQWLNEKDPEKIQKLYHYADYVRKQYMGDEVHLRGIIEFSSFCEKDCNYCGLRESNGLLTRYRLVKKEILQAAENASKLGYMTVVVQSGEDSFYTIDMLCDIVRSIKKQNSLAVTMCVGERTYEEYKQLKEAGCDRYLLKFETSNRSFFEKIKPDASFDNRMQCLEWLRELKYQVGSGIMIGLEGQTVEMIAKDVLFFQELDLDMISVSPFIPHPATPFKDNLGGDVDATLKIIALTRIITKNTHIPATTALGTIDSQGRQKALVCGANVIMPNVTPICFRKLYEIYPDKICINDAQENCKNCMTAMLFSLGRTISTSYGHSIKNK